ncbi:MAG TPA: LysE family translocator [Kribbellaceae bacterium]
MITELATFAGVSAVVIMTPGPDTALTIRNTLLGGRRTGIATALGVGLGQAVWTVAASAGIAALLVASELAFQLVKLLGAAYLVVLGLHSLYDALRRRGTSYDDSPERRTVRREAVRKGLRQGLVSNLGNPKMAVFFLSLLPQFVTPGQASFAGFLLLGAVFALMTSVWLVAYALVVAKVGDLLRRSRVRRVLDGLTGAVLVALGVRLAAESP